MKKYISHLWFAGGVKEFDSDTGKVLNAANVLREEAEFGSVWRQNGRWFVFHKDEKSLILQHKRKVWRLEPSTTVSLQCLLWRKFTIKDNRKIVFTIRYKPRNLFLRLLDPTYDSIDMETDDFFLYVSNMWEKWGDKPFSEFRKQFADEHF